MFGHDFFYHNLIRKYVAIFGTLFNDIHVKHNDVNGNMQDIIVPISYGPRARYIERFRVDPNLKENRIGAIILPRMAFEIMDFQYSADRKLPTLSRECGPNGTVYAPIPYDITFQLSVISRTVTDGNMIAEQIIPFFTPTKTLRVELIPETGVKRDIPITLNQVNFTDTYADDWMEREICLWEFTFTMEAWFYGPATSRADAKVIKFANVSTYPTSSNTLTVGEGAKYLRVLVQPGLTANGEPTTDINETIPYVNIEAEDDWDFIVRYEEN